MAISLNPRLVEWQSNHWSLPSQTLFNHCTPLSVLALPASILISVYSLKRRSNIQTTSSLSTNIRQIHFVFGWSLKPCYSGMLSETVLLFRNVFWYYYVISGCLLKFICYPGTLIEAIMLFRDLFIESVLLSHNIYWNCSILRDV